MLATKPSIICMVIEPLIDIDRTDAMQSFHWMRVWSQRFYGISRLQKWVKRILWCILYPESIRAHKGNTMGLRDFGNSTKPWQKDRSAMLSRACTSWTPIKWAWEQPVYSMNLAQSGIKEATIIQSKLCFGTFGVIPVSQLLNCTLLTLL